MNVESIRSSALTYVRRTAQLLSNWLAEPPLSATGGRIAGVFCVTLVLASTACAQDSSRVWVNTRSGVYHCPGTSAYGTTRRGEYLSESEARRRGYRANGGTTCFPALVADSLARQPGELLPDSAPARWRDSTVECIVARISDGDTIDCAPRGRVRLIGIDAPELDQVPMGSASQQALSRLIPRGSRVQLELDVQPNDRYGRVLAYLWFRGELINWRLVRQGWAVSERFPPNLRHSPALDAAESRARSEQLGLWRTGGFDCRPYQHRSGNC